MLARAQPRLLTNHAFAAHLLNLTVCVGDDPVTRDQPGWYVTEVRDVDRVGEDVAIVRWLGLIVEKTRLHGDADIVGFLVSHTMIFRQARESGKG